MLALAITFCAALGVAQDKALAQAKPDPQNTVILTTKDGDVTISTLPVYAVGHA